MMIMRTLHVVLDEKFIDGAISLYNEDKRVQNDWIHFTDIKDFKFKFIRSPEVKAMPLDNFEKIVHDYDVIVIHCMLSLPFEKIINIPTNIKVVWYAWGIDLYVPYNGTYPLLPLNLFFKETKKIYNRLYKATSTTKRIKRYIKSRIRRKFLVLKAVKRVDYFSGVLPFEYDMLKKKYSCFKAKKLNFNYGSTNYSLLDFLAKLNVTKRENVLIGNSAKMTSNHIDVIHILHKYYKMSAKGVYIIPLNYAKDSDIYVEKVKEIAHAKLEGEINIMDSFIPEYEYY